MPNDPYQIGEDNSGITLVLSDRGVGVAATHAIEHLTGGSDAIQLATASQVGLMSAAFATKLGDIELLADVTDAVNIASSIGGTTAVAAADGDLLPFLDVSTSSALKKTTLGSLRSDYLNTYYVTPTGTQTLTNKTLTAPTINGGSLSGTAITLTDAALTGILPVAKGGTGAATLTGVVKGTGTSALTASAVGLASADVTGTLLVANGGTGATTLTGVVKGTGTGALTASAVGLASADVTGTLPVTKGGTGATTLTGVVKGTGTGALTASAVGLASADVTGTLPVANGGTGVATLTAGVVKASGTSAFTTGAISLTTEVTGVLPVANGGTGFSTNPYGQLGGQTAAASETYSGTFMKLVIDTSLSLAVDFDQPANNRLRYTGATTRRFLVFGSVDITGVLGAHYSIKIYRNGVEVLGTECRANAAGKTSAGTPIAKLVTNWIIELSQNQYVELWVASTDGDAGTPQRMRLVATPV